MAQGAVRLPPEKAAFLRAADAVGFCQAVGPVFSPGWDILSLRPGTPLPRPGENSEEETKIYEKVTEN